MRRNRSVSRDSAFGRNRSWSSPGGTKHSPSGYKYSRNGSRVAPGNVRQRPRARTPRGRFKYSRSPLRSGPSRRARGRRSTTAASRSASRGRSRPSAPGQVQENPQEEIPSVPVIDGEDTPHGVCKFAWQGKRCPFANDKARHPDGCTFSHDVQKYRKKPSSQPAAPAPQESSSAANASADRGANSPRVAGEEQVARDY